MQRVFKQQFWRSLNRSNLFSSGFHLICLATIICPLFYVDFNLILLYQDSPLGCISFILLILISISLVLFPIFHASYVVVADNSITCINRFFPFYKKEFQLSEYKGYVVNIYVPNITKMGNYNMIEFIRPGKTIPSLGDTAFIMLTSSADCEEIAKLLLSKGFAVNVKYPSKY